MDFRVEVGFLDGGRGQVSGRGSRSKLDFGIGSGFGIGIVVGFQDGDRGKG